MAVIANMAVFYEDFFFKTMMPVKVLNYYVSIIRVMFRTDPVFVSSRFNCGLVIIKLINAEPTYVKICQIYYQ